MAARHNDRHCMVGQRQIALPSYLTTGLWLAGHSGSHPRNDHKHTCRPNKYKHRHGDIDASSSLSEKITCHVQCAMFTYRRRPIVHS